MGIDFIRKAAPAFNKGIDRSRIRLATPGLFTQQPGSTPRAYAARLKDGEAVSVGDEVGVRLIGSEVLLFRNLTIIGTIQSPPAELLHGLSGSFGEACAVVHDCIEFAGVAEVTIC
jgi:hypothetical protein